MLTYRYTYLILLLFMASVGVCAKPNYVFQSKNPIANVAWDENDTSRNEQAYFCFNDSTGPINFGEFISRNIIMPDNGADAQALCFIEFDVINDGKIENIKVTSNCNYCNAAVKKAVELSAQYWKLMPLTNKKGIKVRYEYKYKIR